MNVLNVAEKPSVAKEVSNLLSNYQSERQSTKDKYVSNWFFNFNLNGENVNMVFTSVIGHVMEVEFGETHRKWNSCNPSDLFEAPVYKTVPKDKTQIKANLQILSRKAKMLILWLDCDREGENIAFEVLNICKEVNSYLQIKRARFSALSKRDLIRAVNNLIEPNEKDSLAVDARQEIDLRIGAAFTRFQTMLLQNEFDWSGRGENQNTYQNVLLSYGPCQFPTLGLIVQRIWEIESHVPESFWYIFVFYENENKESCEFKWDRSHFFDQLCAELLFELCVEKPRATVVKVEGKEFRKFSPLPLSTVEMQKKVTSYLKIPGKTLMKYAEELYNAGYISYPRTETDSFPNSFNPKEFVNMQINDPRWGSHAQKIINGEMWKAPRRGSHDDHAHPPIHPLKNTTGNEDWNQQKASLYEFIVRSFLACCSKDAIGYETIVYINIANEGFHTKGVIMIERNWLEVYPYIKDTNTVIPNFTEGQTFIPKELLLKKGETKPPAYLTEKDLISKMEHYGIGTDATVTDHIQKQLDRGYATKVQHNFHATPLGLALIFAYYRMGIENLWKPELRGKIENDIKNISSGTKTKNEVLYEAMTEFKTCFISATDKSTIMKEAITAYFKPKNRLINSNIVNESIGICQKCSKPIILTKDNYNIFRIRCGNYTTCDINFSCPRQVLNVTSINTNCESNEHEPIKFLKFELQLQNLSSEITSKISDPGGNHTGCFLCDPVIKMIFSEFRTNNGQNNNRSNMSTSRGGRTMMSQATLFTQVFNDTNNRSRRRQSRTRRATNRRNVQNDTNNSNNAILCPKHGVPVLELISRTAANPNRKFYKCAHETEAQECLAFAWADTYNSNNNVNRNLRGRGQGNNNRRGRTRRAR